MEIELALVVGALYGAGFYMVMRRNIVKIIIGLSLLSHGANLLIFTAAGLTQEQSPIVGADEEWLEAGSADPLPQALILTAIVIGFGITAYTLVLFQCAYRQLGVADVDQMRDSES